MGPGLRDRERSGAFPGGSQKIQLRKIRMQMPVNTKKTACHPKALMIYPPAVGAIMGEAPSTRMSRAKTFALSFIGNKSRTRVTETTVAAQLPSA